MDKQYIRRALAQMNLDKFYDNVMCTLDVWFGKGQETVVTEYISAHVFSGGVFGNKENAEVSKVLKEEKNAGSIKKARNNAFWKAIFLPMKDMKNRYPILVKAPVLAPIMWVARAGRIVVLESYKLKNFITIRRNTNVKKVASKKEMFKIVGLDFSQCHNLDG